jgi:hypothetical protein
VARRLLSRKKDSQRQLVTSPAQLSGSLVTNQGLMHTLGNLGSLMRSGRGKSTFPAFMQSLPVCPAEAGRPPSLSFKGLALEGSSA